MEGTKMTLYKKRNCKVRILNITGGKAIQRMLLRMGIGKGDSVLIKRNARFGGPILLEREGMQIALGKGIAECILVEEDK
jgi:ferrous iron transport protein A